MDVETGDDIFIRRALSMEMSTTDEAGVRWLGAKVEALGGEPEAPGHEVVPIGRD